MTLFIWLQRYKIDSAQSGERALYMENTRRDFLKLSALGLAAAGAESVALTGEDRVPADKPPGSISVRVTYGDKRFAAAPSVSWTKGSTAAGSDSVALDPAKKFQGILGFGGAFTDSSCYLFNQLSASAREQLFQEMFHPSEMGLNVCRTCIGSSDYATRMYSFDEGEPDPELKRFSIDHDREYILPMLREARKKNPDLFLFSSPWSPPGWMKANGSMLGGSMRRKYMPSYANYFVRFLQDYEAESVPVQAVTVQNEVDTDQDGRMPACIWPQEYEADFVRLNLGPAFESNGIKTQIWLIDHNYNLWGRAIGELETPGVRKYANAIAWHGYIGQPEWVLRVRDAFPDAQMHWTEGGPDYTAPNYATDWCDWGASNSTVLRNWCRSITAWNLALDEHGRPNIGPFSCGGFVTIHSQTHEITRSGQFWAFAHFSRAIRRNARRFDTQSNAEKLSHVAFENPDGERVLVLTNPGRERRVQLQLAGMTAEISLPPDSVSTLVWR
jgi:glucosylceramidase